MNRCIDIFFWFSFSDSIVFNVVPTICIFAFISPPCYVSVKVEFSNDCNYICCKPRNNVKQFGWHTGLLARLLSVEPPGPSVKIRSKSQPCTIRKKEICGLCIGGSIQQFLSRDCQGQIPWEAKECSLSYTTLLLSSRRCPPMPTQSEEDKG